MLEERSTLSDWVGVVVAIVLLADELRPETIFIIIVLQLSSKIMINPRRTAQLSYGKNAEHLLVVLRFQLLRSLEVLDLFDRVFFTS